MSKKLARIRNAATAVDDLRDWLVIGGLTVASSVALLGWLITGAFSV
jgi:hypothetical protein